MSTPQTQQPANGQQPQPGVPYGFGFRGSGNIELVDELLGETDVAEYRLKRGDHRAEGFEDELFEALHDKAHALTIRNETEVIQGDYWLDVERDLLSMRLPRPGSPWTGKTRAALMGDDGDKLEPMDEIASMRNYRIAKDRNRMSRKGGKLLELLLKTFSITEMRDGTNKKKKPWYKRIFPSVGGS